MTWDNPKGTSPTHVSVYTSVRMLARMSVRMCIHMSMHFSHPCKEARRRYGTLPCNMLHGVVHARCHCRMEWDVTGWGGVRVAVYQWQCRTLRTCPDGHAARRPIGPKRILGSLPTLNQVDRYVHNHVHRHVYTHVYTHWVAKFCFGPAGRGS